MGWDGTEGRAACGPLSGSFNQNITRGADDGGGARRQRPGPRPRSVVASFVGSIRVLRQSAGGSVAGRPRSVGRSVSRDHTSFVRVVWRRPKRRPVWSPLPPRLSPLPARSLLSLFILGTKRKMDRRFQQSRRKEHKKGARTRGGRSRCEWGNQLELAGILAGQLNSQDERAVRWGGVGVVLVKDLLISSCALLWHKSVLPLCLSY